jgi:DNA-binding transcriptional LysR family regulator
MSIDPRRLVVLHAVDRYGGVVGAATALHVSPSAVSQQLAMLERETGFGLIDRSLRGGQRPLEFTTAGRRLVAHAAALIQVLDDAEAELVSLAGAVSGTVTVAAFFTALRGFAGTALAKLSTTHPGLHPHVVEVDERGAVQNVQSGRIDLAMVEDDAQRRRSVPRGLHYEALADDPFRVAVPTTWPEFDDLTAVAERPWVDGPPDSAVGQAMQRVRRSTGIRLPAAHQCAEFTAGLSLVAAGLGGAFIPQLAVDALSPRDVRVLSLPGLGARRIGVVYRRSRNEPTPVVRAVVDAFRTAADQARDAVNRSG